MATVMPEATARSAISQSGTPWGASEVRGRRGLWASVDADMYTFLTGEPDLRLATEASCGDGSFFGAVTQA
ncbi:hypothetical protein GCM10010216_62680 [Streptomyces flaveolus]|nr:hypothetical protein GCM10010216_62680 [Streptomyces flaveolus]